MQLLPDFEVGPRASLELIIRLTLSPYHSTNTFLSQFKMSYSNRWRDFGILFAYIIFNVCMAIFLYWLIRVPKRKKEKKGKADENVKTIEHKEE